MKEVVLENVLEDIKKERRFENLIIEVHIIAGSDSFKESIEALEKVLRDKNVSKYFLLPLYFTYDEEDSEIRVCFRFEDPKLLGDFIVDRIRPIKGIESTRVRLTLDGKVYPTGLIALSKMAKEIYSAHIFIKIKPLYDFEAWEALRKLEDTGEVFLTWCMRDFYDYDRDISLRVIGSGKEIIRKYVKENVEIIKGVIVTKVKFMKKLIKIQDDSTLVALARCWIEK